MNNNKIELRKIRLVLTPSLLSSFVTILFSVAFQATVIVLARLSSATLQAEVFAVHKVTRGPSTSYQNIVDKLSQNQIINNLPLYVFWGGVGLIVYMVVMQIKDIFSTAYETEREFGYVHIQRNKLLAELLVHLVVRLSALIGLIISFNIFLHEIIPEALLAAHNVAQNVTSQTVLHSLFIVVLMVIILNIQIIFIRLMFLRPRMFSSISEE